MLLQTDLGDSRAVLQNGSQICFTQDSQAEPKNDSNLSLLPPSDTLPVPQERDTPPPARCSSTRSCQTLACSPSRTECAVLLPGQVHAIAPALFLSVYPVCLTSKLDHRSPSTVFIMREKAIEHCLCRQALIYP